ncbi:HNH endonuclease [Fictibacillus fluitans]|uniref:HNH endonuclease signature motif containing protein n=1 Tax=Fictibacillus fluitans TaxID=3058422 RepID=A0ABT8HQZ6_9BACL|nr:HNH endonuclease signature motif containing protein [Fictibacillus sp. NE201]MDN4523191.1 HNH endonuclease signature motif containing protein [Fictibacillus sp. NE201]
MVFSHKLETSDVITHRELIDRFSVSASGGMRRSTKNDLLVLISDHTNPLYDDRWVGDVFHYTGMGQKGDQSIDFAQNKTLNFSNETGVTVYLFEVFMPNHYIFQGEVFLYNEPFQEPQPDVEGVRRLAWIFPLKLKPGQKEPVVRESDLLYKASVQDKAVYKLSDDLVMERARYAPEKPGSRNVVSKVYERNAYVAELAKRRAEGVCQLCDQPAPFTDRKGNPYLENHHIIWLSQGGEDTPENTVALCANCHRKMHALNLNEDVQKLLQISRGFIRINN